MEVETIGFGHEPLTPEPATTREAWTFAVYFPDKRTSDGQGGLVPLIIAFYALSRRCVSQESREATRGYLRAT